MKHDELEKSFHTFFGGNLDHLGHIHITLLPGNFITGGRFFSSELLNVSWIELIIPEKPIEFISVVAVLLHELLHYYLWDHNQPYSDGSKYFLECCEILNLPIKDKFRFPEYPKELENWMVEIHSKIIRRGFKEELIDFNEIE